MLDEAVTALGNIKEPALVLLTDTVLRNQNEHGAANYVLEKLEANGCPREFIQSVKDSAESFRPGSTSVKLELEVIAPMSSDIGDNMRFASPN